uniref:Meckelin n=1 Tax=Eptatretus burgeri TaxID=7764 RepID=A0A8C4QDJ1_EPTBU
MAMLVLEGEVCLCALLFPFLCPSLVDAQQYFLPLKWPRECGPREFFSSTEFICRPCGAGQQRAANGLSCICKPGYRLFRDYGGANITCSACNTGEAVTQDGWDCIQCGAMNSSTKILSNGKCACHNANEILVERTQNGKLLNQAGCQLCDAMPMAYTWPNSERNLCAKCGSSFIISAKSCDCSDLTVADGLCFSSSASVDARIDFPLLSLPIAVTSSWFAEHLLGARLACQNFRNTTACQALGNMCVMAMGSLRATSGPCQILLHIGTSSTGSHTNNIPTWPVGLPWIYYNHPTLPGDTRPILEAMALPNTFSTWDTQKRRLHIVLAKYDIQGNFLGYGKADGGKLQLCSDTASRIDSAYIFGTTYRQMCSISISVLQSHFPEPTFFEPFLEFEQNGQLHLYALPVLNLNLHDSFGTFINQGSDRRRWVLMRRFLLVDAVGGLGVPSSHLLRFVSSLSIFVTLVPGETLGRIFPPLLSLRYSEIDLETAGSDSMVQVSFSVDYSMKQGENQRQTDIALAVLGSLAVLHALQKTVSWRRRQGLHLLDLPSVVNFLIFFAGLLANVFFLVAFGTGLYWLIFYKNQQQVTVLLPSEQEEMSFVIYVSCALGLKFLQILHLLIFQTSVDIFFLDWERPRDAAEILAETSQTSMSEGARAKSTISIWRTYFVANEWIELQTIRKLSPALHILLTIFFLQVIGFENLALREPTPSLLPPLDTDAACWSRILRFGVCTSVWIVLGFLQIGLHSLCYERFIEDKIRQFVDLCSMSNVSVLIFSHCNFGYYIHGRSVHGRGDASIDEMYTNLKKEEENRCSCRGLLPNADVQTFEVATSINMRRRFEAINQTPAVVVPARLNGQALGVVEQNIQSYHIMNRFLSAFIDHAYKDMDYIVRDKTTLEKVLDMEIQEPLDKSLFYNDPRHSFSRVLCYGHSSTLLLFEMLLFCVVDLASQDLVLAAVITYFMQAVQPCVENIVLAGSSVC